ncbi:MAG: M48 family metallopeptidase [Cycloclasticus sp.]
MFANFAAKRHLTGPLRAVSPVVADDTEINWKSVNKWQGQPLFRKSVPAPSDNSLKLNRYFQQAFKGSVPIRRSSWQQSLQLFYVEALSLFIPMLYISCVLAIFSVAILFFSEPMVAHILGEQYLDATLWACPAVLATGLLLFLLSPLFGGFRSYHGRVLQPHEAPALMSLVNELSRHLNVRPPKRIEINNETALRVDAYAGVNSIYRDEYKIIIGAPLLMSLTVNQLTAMLAHELSHFRVKQQKVAFYLMHHVSEWLYVRASGQDKRHGALLKRMQKENISSYEYSELWVWQRMHLLQQAIFAGLFALHRQLTSWKCHEIELETDAMAISVVGSKDFSDMLHKVRVIQNAQGAVSAQNAWAWQEGFLLDDYALAVAMESQKISSAQASTLQRNHQKEVTRFCPNDRMRLDQARALGCPGKLSVQLPAAILMDQAQKLSRELTLLDYEASGIEQAEGCLLSSSKIRQLKLRQDKLKAIARRYFDGRVDDRVMKFEPSEERDVAGFDVQTCINHVRRYRVEDRQQQATATNLLKRITKSYVVERLLHSKLPVAKYLNEAVLVRKDAGAYLKDMRLQYERSLHRLEAMDQVFYRRAQDTMNYLDMKARGEVSTAFHNLELYSQVRREVAALKEACKPLNLLVNGMNSGASTRVLQAGANEKQRLWAEVSRLRGALRERPIQVRLSRKEVHVLTYLDFKLGELASSSDEVCIEAMATYVDELLQLLQFQYLKWQAQLAVIMHRFEQDNDITQVNLLR